MKKTSVLGAMAVLLAGGLVAGAEPRGPQEIDRDGTQPPGGPGGAMQEQCPMGQPPAGQPPMGGPGGATMNRHGQMERPPMAVDAERLKKAGAAEAQIQALEDFEFEQAGKRIDLAAAAQKAELTLNHLMKAKTTDEKAVMQAVDVVSQTRGDLFKLELTYRLKEKQVLGEEILKKLHEMGPPQGMGPGMTGPRGGDNRSEKKH